MGVPWKPDDANYDPHRLCLIQDGGQWQVTQRPDNVEFRHALADPAAGYAYDHRRTVLVVGHKPEMVLGHVLRNIAKRKGPDVNAG